MMKDIRKLWGHLTVRRHKQFYLLFFMMVVVSVVEMIGIGSVVPFLGVLSSPDQVFKNELVQPVIQALGINSSDELILPMTVFFVAIVMVTGIARLLMLYVMTRFVHDAGCDLSVDIYKRTLYQSYSVHISRNSSEVINGVINKTNTVVGGVVSPALVLLSSSILLFGILSALILIDIVVALSSFLVFATLYLVVVRYTRKQLKENGKCIAVESTNMIKSLQEGLGGIRDVLIDGAQQYYWRLYRKSEFLLRRAAGNNEFIFGSPRYLMETLGVMLIAGMAYLMTQREGGLESTIPMLGALALGAQRLLPELQKAYSAYTSIKGSQASFEDVLKLLEQPLPSDHDESPSKPMEFNRMIMFRKVDFRYSSDTPWVVKDVTLEIPKGARVGFVGATGSGKSTLLDIFMGLLHPTKGELIVDDKVITNDNYRSWQARIAHVPQAVYLSDATIQENIAFGIPEEEFDYNQVELAAQKAQLSELIEGWKDKYKTVVGERGVRLSGGQRQRIGIARALYKKADVLIFDEATSALDTETENAVMQSIDLLGDDLTIMIIAHRLTTLKGCNLIVEIGNKGVLQTGSYHEMLAGK